VQAVAQSHFGANTEYGFNMGYYFGLTTPIFFHNYSQAGVGAYDKTHNAADSKWRHCQSTVSTRLRCGRGQFNVFDGHFDVHRKYHVSGMI
jgi:hypothetical protein